MNPLKEKLARGELTASMTVRLVSSVEIVRIAKTAGFDAIYVDLEHSAFSIETTCQLSVMALEAGLPAVSTGTDLGFLMAACTERAKQVRNLKL